MIYLDYNATTPVLPEVFEEMKKYFLEDYGNAGSRTHEYGMRANKAVEANREKISQIVKCQPCEVLFTSGATESNNIVILGLSTFGKKTDKHHIISSSIEHKAVLEPLKEMEKNGFKVTYLPVGHEGRINPDDIKKIIKTDTLLVSIMHVNNETGVIQPITEIANLLENYPDVYFHVDAAQGYGKIIGQLQHHRIDFISISGHKIYASKGVGALIVKSRNYKKVPLKPLMFGGGQEKGLRPGTLAVPLIVGLGKASEIAFKNAEVWNKKNLKIRIDALQELSKLNYIINGNIDFVIPHVLNICFPGIDSEAIFVTLKNIAAISNGSACTSNSYKPSHVLKAMGFNNERIESSVRISWGADLTHIEWSKIVHSLRKIFF